MVPRDKLKLLGKENLYYIFATIYYDEYIMEECGDFCVSIIKRQLEEDCIDIFDVYECDQYLNALCDVDLMYRFVEYGIVDEPFYEQAVCEAIIRYEEDLKKWNKLCVR
jgi:hypothetical protein